MGWEHEHEKIRSAIQKKYAEVSRNARGKFAYLTGYEGALALDYDVLALSLIPREIMQSFCGVGNPFKAGPLSKGESFLDVGCGAGIDLILASQYVGETGRICGIDITPEMLRIAEQNIESMDIRNVEAREGSAESIPYEDDTFDIVISNGVLNLSTRKKMAFLEIFRVLGPGGRLQFADIVLQGERARETPCTLEAWSD